MHRTLFERDALTVTDVHGPGCISHAHRAHLVKLEPSLPGGSLTWTGKGVRFGSYCGVLRLGDETLEILPKVFRDGNDSAENRSLLIHMLRLSGTLPWLRNWQGSFNQQSHHLLDVFIKKFCDDLHAALAGGLARNYRSTVDELTVIRGRFDVIDHARRLPGNKHKVVCRFDEFDEDTPINRILRHCLERLSEIVRSGSIRRDLEELRFRFDGVSPIRYRHSLISEIRLDRSLARFQDAWAQCCWLLQGLYPDAVAGPSPQASLLFDMESLFEDSVYRIARRELQPQGYTVTAQGPRRFLLKTPDGSTQRRHMKPDLVIETPTRERIILDCKWKTLDEPHDVIKNITSADLYQLYTYAQEYKAKSVGLVYPWVSGLPEQPLEMRYAGIEFPVWFHFVKMDVFKGRSSQSMTEAWRAMFGGTT